MPTFGQQFWQGFTEVNALRDYTHASKVFTPNSFELKPRYKFLFHVSFTVNQIPGLNNFLGTNDQTQLSYVVKTVDLPKFTINNETLNQYNRKRVIQTKVNYDPVNITFHDDGGDNVRKMWYAYYNYYYKDADQPYLDVPTGTQLGQVGNKINAFGYNKRDIYSPTRESNVNDWGYIGESFKDGNNPTGGKPPFFKDIQIYGFDQHKTATYVLINPLITNWSHDQYSYSEGSGTMQNSMAIAYESVKYYGGAVATTEASGDPNAHGFGDPSHYDKTLSPISRPGSRNTVMGQGGLLDAAGGILEDLSPNNLPLGLIGAAQKAGTAYNTFKGKNLKSLALNEVVGLGTNVLKGAIPSAMRQIPGRASGMYYPTPKNPPTN